MSKNSKRGLKWGEKPQKSSIRLAKSSCAEINHPNPKNQTTAINESELCRESLNQAYQRATNSRVEDAGSKDINIAFRVAEGQLKTPIPRPAGSVGTSDEYRRDINRLLLQTFGLGATVKGKLESIPTHHMLRESYEPAAKTQQTPQKDAREDKSPGPSWENLLPLLNRQPR